jgi:hypothetical protein
MHSTPTSESAAGAGVIIVLCVRDISVDPFMGWASYDGMGGHTSLNMCILIS